MQTIVAQFLRQGFCFWNLRKLGSRQVEGIIKGSIVGVLSDAEETFLGGWESLYGRFKQTFSSCQTAGMRALSRPAETGPLHEPASREGCWRRG